LPKLRPWRLPARSVTFPDFIILYREVRMQGCHSSPETADRLVEQPSHRNPAVQCSLIK
jgi:hypothetical protein